MAAGVAIEYNARLPLIGTCIRAFQNIYVSRSAVYGQAKHQPSVMGDRSKTVSQAIAERWAKVHCLAGPAGMEHCPIYSPSACACSRGKHACAAPSLAGPGVHAPQQTHPPLLAWSSSWPACCLHPSRPGCASRAGRACRARDSRFPMLVMAPEGTCGDGRCILEFKRGAFMPGVPVLPVLLRYDSTCHNPAWGICNVPFGAVRPSRAQH